MIATAMSDGPVIIDSSDRIAGYPVIHQHPVDGDGRVVLVDRGAQYRMRYVVGWQPTHSPRWHDGVLVERLDVAIEVFVVRARGTHGDRWKRRE